MNDNKQTSKGGQVQISRAKRLANSEQKRSLRYLCALAGRALPNLSARERVTLYRAMAFVLPDRQHAAQAEFAAFALTKADEAQRRLRALLTNPEGAPDADRA